MNPILVGTQALTAEAFVNVVFYETPVALDEAAQARVLKSAEFVQRQAQRGTPVYGVTTGFGANRNTTIDPAEAEQLQYNLIVSHACGVGKPLSREVVRGMLLLRINALAQGYSGIQLATLDTLVAMLNRGVHPVVPELGSVGASGDLCPLAHMCLPLLGLGHAEVDGEILEGEAALAKCGLSPIKLTFKEGLALLNGTQAMTSLGLVAARRLERLLDIADAAAALSLDALAGRSSALDARIHVLRGRRGQMVAAHHMRAMTSQSELVDAQPGFINGKKEYIQDSYCLRCAPQVHGASRDVLTHVLSVLVCEANAVTDNPIVFDDTEEILSGGNFHGEPVAMALDYLKIAISEIANISERRCAKLVDKAFNEGLPAFLVYRPGLNSGHMIPQYVAAALVAECKVLSHPASVDSIPTSANMEDHVSMGCHAGRYAHTMIEHAERVVAIELMIAAQALDLRKPKRPGSGSVAVVEALRAVVSFMAEDRLLYPDIEAVTALVQDDQFWALVRHQIGAQYDQEGV